MQHGRITLTRYTIEAEHKHPGASGEFSGLLNSLATAIKIISNQVNKGATTRWIRPAATPSPVSAMVPVDVFERLVTAVSEAAVDLHRPVGCLAHQWLAR